MAEFGVVTGGGTTSFGTGEGGGGGGQHSACMAHRAIDLYIQYSADMKTIVLKRWYWNYTIFCGKLSDRTPEKGGWPIWAYQLWEGRFPPDCIKCTGDDGGSARADRYNSGGSWITGEMPAGYNNNFRIRFGPFADGDDDEPLGKGVNQPRKIVLNGTLHGYRLDVDISSLKQLGCCDCCPYEKQFSQRGYDDETNVPNPNAWKPLINRGLSQKQMTDLMSQKLAELDREVVTKQCCV